MPDVAAVEQLGERVLQQRQRAGLVATSATISATRPGSNATPTRSAGSAIARSSSSGASGVTDLGAAREQLAEAAVLERPVVEVGPQRGDDPDAAAGRDGGPQRVEERVALALVVGQREELLELVDHEQARRSPARLDRPPR